MPRVINYKYNIYKIRKDSEDALIDLIALKGLAQEVERVQGDYSLKFFLCEDPDVNSNVAWVRQYGELITPAGRNRVRNVSFYGLLIISSETVCYAVPLGKSHNFLKEYAESDFGIDLACRIADSKSVPMTSIKAFGWKKTKAIETYAEGTSLELESGEALEYVRSRTVDSALWGKTASFGVSVLLSVPTELASLHELIDRVEAQLEQPPAFEPARATLVKSKSTQAKLDDLVGAQLLEQRDSPDTYANEVQVEGIELSGIEFVFRQDHSCKLRISGMPPSDLQDFPTTSGLISYLDDLELAVDQNWNSVELQYYDANGAPQGKEKIRKALNCIVGSEDKYYFLQSGQWREFKPAYIKSIEDAVAQIDVQNGGGELDLNVTQFEAWKADAPENELKYKEYWYNKYVLSADGTGRECFDRQLFRDAGYSIEPLDVYEEASNTFIAVKRWGEASDLAYLVDQATAALHLLKPDKTIPIEDRVLSCRKSQLLLVRNGARIEDFSGLKSLMVLHKIDSFRKICRDKGIGCEVRFQYEV